MGSRAGAGPGAEGNVGGTDLDCSMKGTNLNWILFCPGFVWQTEVEEHHRRLILCVRWA